MINLTDGNAAYLFIPAQANLGLSPILSFRGTDPGEVSGSIIADVGFVSIIPAICSAKLFPSPKVGETVLANDTLKIKSLLEYCNTIYGKCTLIGHSLGGNLASRFSVEGTNAQYVKELNTFNAPGVSDTELTKYHNLEQRFPATAYTSESDPINLIAENGFFGTKKIITPHDIDLKKQDPHGTCILGSQDFRSTNIHSAPPLNKWGWKKIACCATIAPAILMLVCSILWRIGLIIVAIGAETYHKFGSGNKVKNAHNAARIYEGGLGLQPPHVTLDNAITAARIYYREMKKPQPLPQRRSCDQYDIALLQSSRLIRNYA